MNNFFLILIVVMLSSCGQNDDDISTEPQFTSQSLLTEKEYIFAIHPLHNLHRLFMIYGPLIDYLDRNIPDATFRLEASRNYGEFDKKLYAQVPDFALPNPYQTFNSLQYGYHVIAKMGDDQKFKGVILVRRDSDIKQVSDLKGKKISFPARTALAATIMPQYYLYIHGLDVNHDIVNVYVGSQESSIMNVYLGYVAAGATWPLPWAIFQQEQPDKARELEVKWATEPMLNNGVVVRDNVPEEVAQRVAELLNTLHTTEEGRIILARMPLSRFELANDQRYQVIGNFLQMFDKTVRHLDEIQK